jgi:hypothetical protein
LIDSPRLGVVGDQREPEGEPQPALSGPAPKRSIPGRARRAVGSTMDAHGSTTVANVTGSVVVELVPPT